MEALIATLGPLAVSLIAQIFGQKTGAKQQTDASKAAIAAQLEMFGITQTALQPYLSGGASAMGLLTGVPGTAAVGSQWIDPATGKTVAKPFGFKPPAGGVKVTVPGTAAVPGHWTGGGATVDPVTGTATIGGGKKTWVPPVAAVPAHTVVKNWKQVSAGKAGTAAKPGALPDLMKPITVDAAAIEANPAYQFAMREGLKSTGNALTQRGMDPLGSGAGVKGAETFASGLAAQNWQQYFQNALANKEMAWKALYGSASLGESAATGIGTAASTAGQDIGTSLTNIGTAQASATHGVSDALSGFANQIYQNNLLAQSRAAIPTPGSGNLF